MLGITRSGNHQRVTSMRSGVYLDGFIYPEKSLLKVGEAQLQFAGGRVLVEKDGYGEKLLGRLERAQKKRFKPDPANEIKMKQVWSHKMLARIQRKDIEGNFRRVWLLEALLADYFSIRKKRFSGSKQAFMWLRQNDPNVYKLFDRALADPKNFIRLKKLVEAVSQREVEIKS